jgi:hypothetical protein
VLDYGVDEILRVQPPTPEKVQAAFLRAQEFAAAHPGQKLEAFIAYQAHGTAEPEGDAFREGSREWVGLVGEERLTESFLKGLERDCLGQYGYVVGYNGSCKGGALIA